MVFKWLLSYKKKSLLVFSFLLSSLHNSCSASKLVKAKCDFVKVVKCSQINMMKNARLKANLLSLLITCYISASQYRDKLVFIEKPNC